MKSNINDLLPCPFCGNPPIQREDKYLAGTDTQSYEIRCINMCPIKPFIATNDYFDGGDYKEKAIKAWNTRQLERQAKGLVWITREELKEYSDLKQSSLKLNDSVFNGDKGDTTD
jgi:hypothetical protein